MLTRRVAVFAGLFVPLASAAGCSLINAYDAVKEAPGDDSGTGGDDAAGDDVTTPMDGTMAVESGTLDGAGGGGDGSSDVVTGIDDAPSETTATTTPEAAIDAGAPGGAIVIGGHISTGGSGLTYVLDVLDPATGNLKTQETMPVAGVSYDPNLDVWYVFDTGMVNNPFPSPGTPVILHVRKLDTRPGGTWAWTEIATLNVPPIYGGQLIAPFVDRLAYVAYAPVDSSAAAQLTVIDTTALATGPADASNLPISSAPLSFSPTGLTGIPTSGGVGGVLALLQNSAGVSTAGLFQFVTAAINISGITVNSSAYPLAAAPNQEVAASCGTSVTAQGYNFLFATPFFTSDGGISSEVLSEWTSNNTGMTLGTGTPASVAFSGTGTRFDPIAFSSCSGLAFIGEAALVSTSAANLLFALPVDGTSGPSPYTVPAGSVSSLAYEPFTGTAVATGGSVQNPFILGLQVTGSGATSAFSNRALQSTPNWSPPTNLSTLYIAVRQPSGFQCP